MIEIEKPRIERVEASDSYGKFVVEPLEHGFGQTLGNSLRRVLLSSLPGVAVSSIRIEGIQHEFSAVPGVKEDVAEIILNLKELSDHLLMVWIEGSEEHTEDLVRRFDRAPKPMYYQPAFLEKKWLQYRVERGLREDEVNPDDFIRWTYHQALAHRQPRYAAMARNWGVKIKASDVALVRDEKDLTSLIAAALPA